MSPTPRKNESQGPSEDPGPGAELTLDERAELEHLRALVAATQALPQAVAVAQPEPRRTHRGRWAGSMVLLLIAALLAPLSALATFTRSTVLDTDKYLAMVAPLAKNPAVQQEISLRITDAVFEQLKVKQLTTQTLDAIAARPRVEGVTENLPVQLSTFAEPISERDLRVHRGPGEQPRRVEHLPGRLGRREPRGARGPGLRPHRREHRRQRCRSARARCRSTSRPFITAIKPVLVERGVPFADRIPVVNASFVVLNSDNLGTAQTAIRLLDLLRATCCRCSPSWRWSRAWRSPPPAGARSSSVPRWWSARSCSCCSPSRCWARSTSTTSRRCCSCRRSPRCSSTP